MLQMGSSVHWKKTLKKFTGQTKIRSSSIIKYFEPLYKWLKRENQNFKFQKSQTKNKKCKLQNVLKSLNNPERCFRKFGKLCCLEVIIDNINN